MMIIFSQSNPHLELFENHCDKAIDICDETLKSSGFTLLLLGDSLPPLAVLLLATFAAVFAAIKAP